MSGTGTIEFIEGDLFQALPEYADKNVVITHVVNNKGGFGSGFVVPLTNKYPLAKESYLKWFNDRQYSLYTGETVPFELGQVQFVGVSDDAFGKPATLVAHMLAQTLGGSRPLYYNHLVNCMNKVRDFVKGMAEALAYKNQETVIVAPLFGGGLAGGNFNFIEKLIEDCWLREGISVKIYYLSHLLPSNWTPPKA